jgi:hypothetical protein
MRDMKYCTAGLEGDERGPYGPYPPPPNDFRGSCSRYFLPKTCSNKPVSPKFWALTILPLR